MSFPMRKRGLCSRKEAAKEDSASHSLLSVRERHCKGEGGRRGMGRGEEGWREGGRRRERVEGRSMVGGREGGRKGRGMIGRKAVKVL